MSIGNLSFEEAEIVPLNGCSVFAPDFYGAYIKWHDSEEMQALGLWNNRGFRAWMQSHCESCVVFIVLDPPGVCFLLIL